jgi:adenylosuccinate synthase
MGRRRKGKIVDWLSARADVVRALSGRHNAGHTLVSRRRDLQAVVAAVRRGAAGKLAVIGNGVVVDPWAFWTRIAAVKALGVAVTPDNLDLAENATLILRCIANST